MTVLKRVSQKEMKRRTGFGRALGYTFPDKDEILIRKDLPKKVEKKVIEHEEEHLLKGEEGPGLFDFLGNIFGASKQAKEAKRSTQAQEKAFAAARNGNHGTRKWRGYFCESGSNARRTPAYAGSGQLSGAK
jgi:hypothetical protein